MQVLNLSIERVHVDVVLDRSVGCVLIQPDTPLELLVLRLHVVDLMLEVTAVGFQVNDLAMHFYVLPITCFIVPHILFYIHPLRRV